MPTLINAMTPLQPVTTSPMSGSGIIGSGNFTSKDAVGEFDNWVQIIDKITMLVDKVSKLQGLKQKMSPDGTGKEFTGQHGGVVDVPSTKATPVPETNQQIKITIPEDAIKKLLRDLINEEMKKIPDDIQNMTLKEFIGHYDDVTVKVHGMPLKLKTILETGKSIEGIQKTIMQVVQIG